MVLAPDGWFCRSKKIAYFLLTCVVHPVAYFVRRMVRYIHTRTCSVHILLFIGTSIGVFGTLTNA